MQHDLDRTIRRGIRFADQLQFALVSMNEDRQEAELREIAAVALAKLAAAHSDGALRLFRLRIDSPAFALVRPQFEAVLRSAWVRFAAPNEWIDGFMQSIPADTTEEPARFPKIAKMLEQLGTSSNTPPRVHESLDTLKTKAIEALHSYTHGGLRQITRVTIGYEAEMVFWMVRTSCSLRYFASQLIAHIFENPTCSRRLDALRQEYADCMHSN